MSYSHLITTSVLFATILSSSCTRPLQVPPSPTIPGPTLTQALTAIPPPSPSPTPSPSAIPTPRPTRTPLSEFEFTRQVHYEHAGFNYPSVVNFLETYRRSLVVLSSQDENLLILLLGATLTEQHPLQDLFSDFTAKMAMDIDQFEIGEPITTAVQAAPALAADVSGLMFDRAIVGRLTYVLVSPLQYFVAFGNASPERWVHEGLPLYTTLLREVSFFKPTPLSDGCPITSDRTYGYRENNPIRVGPSDFLTLALVERQYLDSLIAPGGHHIEYERLHSQPTDDTILDVYRVTYPGGSLTLYLDAYSGEPFRVPRGLACGP